MHISTASRALNERTAALLNPQPWSASGRRADGLGYRVNGMARALKTRRSMSIGMVVPDITNPFFPPAVRGAEDVLDRAGYSLLLSSTDNDLGKARRQIAAMLEGQADGLLLAMARRDDPLVNELRAGGTPLVLVNRTIDRGGVSAVVPDDFNGAVEAVEHLYALGHRGWPSWAARCPPRTAPGGGPALMRRCSALACPRWRRWKLPPSTRPPGTRRRRPCSPSTRGSPEWSQATTWSPSGSSWRPPNEAGTAPGDISVVGFNDMLLAGRLQPPLTTIRIPQYDVGARAAELLMALVAEPGRNPETVLISGELVVRGSTGPPPAPAARAPLARRRPPSATGSAGPAGGHHEVLQRPGDVR